MKRFLLISIFCFLSANVFSSGEVTAPVDGTYCAFAGEGKGSSNDNVGNPTPANEPTGDSGISN
jgi:hypothetical protein